MDSRNRTRPSADEPAVITASTLKGAYKLVKQTYGEDAIILGSRTVTRRQAMGLGHEKFVEVTVQPPGSRPSRRSAVARTGSGTGGTTPAQLEAEIERIESLVAEMAEDLTHHGSGPTRLQDNPLAEALLAAGTTAATVEKILTRYLSETGQSPDNRVAALAWLGENLKASNCEWEGFYGCHAFLGPEASGSTALILDIAARLHSLGRRTLVLSVMPPHDGRIKQLQVAAARHGFDAAVIQKPQQLTRSEKHLEKYEVVLVDMPAANHPQMDQGRILHGWLSANTGFHRHLVLPAFYDPGDMAFLQESARAWNCDWLALTGLQSTGRPGKILDYVDTIPLPLSLVGEDGRMEIAASAALLDFILGQPLPRSTTAASDEAEG